MRYLFVFLICYATVGLSQKPSAEKLLEQASAYQKQGKPQHALITLNECIEKFPLEPRAYQARASLYEFQNKLTEALTDLNIALELVPESAEFRLSRAALAFRVKRFDLARPDFQKLLKQRGSETNLVFFRITNDEGVDNMMTAQSNVPDQYYNYLGLIDFMEGDLTSAILYFDSAIAFNAKQADYFSHRGQAHLEIGNLIEATKDLNHALLLNPNHAVSKNNLATIKRKEGKLEEAKQLLLEAKIANAKAKQHHAQLALMQLETGQYAESILNFDTAILIDNREGELFLGRGQAKEKQRNLPGALADYSQAIKIDNQWPKAWFMEGNVFLKLGQYQEALENYNAALALDNKYVLAYHNRAIVHSKLGHKQQACEDIRQAARGMTVDAQTIKQVCDN